MASHLTFTPSASVSIGSNKGLNAQLGVAADAEADAGGGLAGAFTALLDAVLPSAPVTAPNAGAATQPDALGLAGLSLEAELSGDADEEPEDPEAIAAALAASLPVAADVAPDVDVKEMLESLLKSLNALKACLEAGEPLDPDFMSNIDGKLNKLADALGVDFTDLPSLDDITALLAGSTAANGTIAQKLIAGIAPLAEKLADGTAKVDHSAEVDAAELAKTIGAKLAALLQSVDGEAGKEQLAALGLDANASLDAKIEAAIAKLLVPPVAAEAKVPAVALAQPVLKVPEPILSGKAPTDTTANVETKVELPEAEVDLKVAALPSKDAETGDGATPDHDQKPADAKTTGAITVAAVAETTTLPDPQASSQSTQVASRIDAAAARPVIQAGYQTSQQQLNLPQLAFELVRQVNDGNTRFQMRLDPPELGKIDVRLDIDSTGQVNARLTVERAETLDLMQRDQRALEKALQQAGLDGAKTNLEFSLKQSPFSGGNQQGQDGSGRQPGSGAGAIAEAEDTPPPTVNLYRGSLTASGVNIIA